MTVSVATFNFGKAGRIPDADIIGCQEAGDQGDTIRAWMVEHPFGESYDGNGQGGRQRTPILHDTSVVEFLGGSAPLILKRDEKATIGAGRFVTNKFAVTARFRVLANGGEFTVVNVHGVPSLWNLKRRRLHREQMNRLTAHVKTITGPCVIVGDFNCRWSHKHLNGLRALGFRLDNPKGWTHRPTRRRIDLVMSRGMDKSAPARLVDTGSDHRAVIVDYDVPAPTLPRAEPVKEPAVKFVTRAQWGAPARGATTSSHPIGNPRGVTLHWTGPGVGAHSHDRCASKVYAIWRYHTGGNGWADIAYNLLVCQHGYVFEGRGANVASAANGGTASNQSHYAVCYLGGEGDPFTDEGKQGFRDAVTYLRIKGGAGPEVNGHRDHKATACPGDVIYRWLKTEKFTTATTTTEDDVSARDFLNEPLNEHNPKGRIETREVTVREALTALVILIDRGEGAAKTFLDRARSTKEE